MTEKMDILDFSHHPGSSPNGSARALSQWGVRVLAVIVKDTGEAPVMSLFILQTFTEPRPYRQETYCPLGETNANPGSTIQCDE